MSTWFYSPARKYHKALQITVANISQRQQHNQQLFRYLKMDDNGDNDIDDDDDDYVTDDSRHTIKPSDKDQEDSSYKPTHGPTNSPTRSPSTNPTFQPSIYYSILPSSFPTTATPTFSASIIPSFMPSDDCSIGEYYGIQTSINTRILFEYEIKFTQELPDLYLDRVILPYLREVFALSLFVSPPYCGEECVMRRVKFRSEDMPTTNQSQNQQLDIRPNLQDLSSIDNAKELLYMGLIDDLMGVGLGPEYDVVNFEKLCDNNVTEMDPTAYESCVHINGYLVLHHNTTTDADAENIANHTLARLQEGMDQDWYSCNDENLNILDVVWKGGQIYGGFDKKNTDDDAIIIKNVESNKISSSSIAMGAALLLVLLALALFFVRKRFRGIDSDTVISDITGGENADNSSFVAPLIGSKTTRGWDVVKGGESLVTSYNKTIV